LRELRTPKPSRFTSSTFLTPTLSEGQVMIDNLGAHWPKRTREFIEARGAELMFLPPYWPGPNPIEQAFSKIKNILRKLGAHSRCSVGGDGGGALGDPPGDAAGWFDHCGYQVEVQHL
jgi:DDE superfamily endonuclease